MQAALVPKVNDPIAVFARRRYRPVVALCLCLIFNEVFADMQSDSPGVSDPETVATAPVLRLASVNMAHGRGQALNQLLVGKRKIRANLREIAAVVKRLQADVLALQEADAPSLWSGRFDHIDYLVQHTGYRHRFHGIHASNWIYSFGTALLSRYPLSLSETLSFEPSFPSTNKGFVSGRIRWNPGKRFAEALDVTVLSVHLDFMRAAVRSRQTRTLIDYLKSIRGPSIVMGDFNSEWSEEDSAIRGLAQSAGLHVYHPELKSLGTYKKSARLDWIALSPQLEFSRYNVLQIDVSDHLPVIAEITYRGSD